MIINIYGSTGQIGKKALALINKYFPEIKINLLCANSNTATLLNQIKLFKPKYVYLNNKDAAKIIKTKLNKNTQLFSFKELKYYLKKSKSDYSLLAISGYKSLYYLDDIVNNTNNLGLVSKEAVVSAGHLFEKKKYFNKTNIFPLDSEHFSLFEYINSYNSKNIINKITITASGGPFYKQKFKNLSNVKFNQAVKHPKWKMGYKNSIDSATLVNKCLEVIETHYLFNIPYQNIKVLIHPEALVHSIVEKDNYTSNLNMFKNDMSIPILNFLMSSKNKKKIVNSKFNLSLENLNFFEVKNDHFPIYKYFNNLDKSNPANLIKFNIGNEFAVNLFKKNLIKYTDIYKIIKKVGSLNLYSSLNTIKDVIEYHEKFEKKIKTVFNKYN